MRVECSGHSFVYSDESDLLIIALMYCKEQQEGFPKGRSLERVILSKIVKSEFPTLGGVISTYSCAGHRLWID